MFLDESGDHSLDKIDNSYPMFVLAGCIFDFDYYSKVVEPKINELKIKHFGKTDIILRSYDIRKQKKDFSCLVDKIKREAFYNDLNVLMKSYELWFKNFSVKQKRAQESPSPSLLKEAIVLTVDAIFQYCKRSIVNKLSQVKANMCITKKAKN